MSINDQLATKVLMTLLTKTNSLTCIMAFKTSPHLSAWAAVTKYHRLRGLNRRNRVFPQLWRFKV